MTADLWCMLGIGLVAVGLIVWIGLDAANDATRDLRQLTEADWDTFTITPREETFRVPPDGEPHA